VTARSAIIEAQRKILKVLAVLEDRIGDLYASYSERYSYTRALWVGLVEEERSHALMLASLEKQLDAGFMFWNLGLFSVENITSEIRRIDELIAQSKEPAFEEKEALFTASRIETSVLDSGFYAAVQSDSPEFVHIAKALNEATKTHVNRVQKALQSFQR
jgi:hypothetical protein